MAIILSLLTCINRSTGYIYIGEETLGLNFDSRYQIASKEFAPVVFWESVPKRENILRSHNILPVHLMYIYILPGYGFLGGK